MVETEIDSTDLISVPGYAFIAQQRQQHFIRKSGGIGIFLRNDLSDKIHQICTDSDYILWLKMDKSLFNIEQDFLLDILYIPPMQSRFLNGWLVGWLFWV